ncbi:hypothetical protein [Paenibacillus amylolyticus]|uniref:hypothetical protein n=1 Tax=Paenibacillus amylolyticus TaxID=1451 RepID=UPI003EBF2EA5
MQSNLLEHWKEEYLSNDETYRNHVTKFVRYITSIGKGNLPITITKDDVIKCIEHYNQQGKIKTISTMESHLESIKAFYKYLVGRKYADDIFNNIASFQDFKDKIASRYNLTNPKNRAYWDESELVDILEAIDGYFERITLAEIAKVNEKKKYFKFLVLRLFIKLTLIAPTKRSVICALKKSDFSADFRFMIVNEVIVRIPSGLTRDITNSIKIAEFTKQRSFEENESILDFVYNDEFRVGSLNEFFCTFLKSINLFEIPDHIVSYPVEVIMDSALYEMVKNGANPALIAKINGTKISALEKKFYSNGIPINDSDELINHEIAKNRYYNYI